MSTAPKRRPVTDLDAALGEADRLRDQVAMLLGTHQELASLLVAADTRAGELMKLLVAVRALIEARDAAAALDSLQDILVNVVGTDDYVIYSIDPLDNMLVPIAGVGASLQSAERVSLYGGWIGEVVRSGTLVLGKERTSGPLQLGIPAVAAVVPLKVLDRVVGGIVIGQLLPHRDLLGSCDRELLGLLGAYAATAIIAAGRRAAWRELPRELR